MALRSFTTAFVCSLVSLSSAHAEECPRGATTQLEIEILYRPKFLMHDQNVGRERLKLSAAGQELARIDSEDGRWQCLAFSPERGHIVGMVGETGVLWVMQSISYLGESAHELASSAFTRSEFLAYAALAREDGRYVAFIGQNRNTAMGLFLLDVHTDSIKRVGPAPKPPPHPEWECESGFDWGVTCVEGYEDLGPEIWHFERDTLVVSYGKDTLQRRASKRNARKYKL